MTCLVAVLSSGKGTWAYLGAIIEKEPWEKIFLVTNDFGRENFGKRVKTEKQVEFIVLNPEKTIPELIDSIAGALSGKIADFQVALNIISGEGKEHTAVLAALLRLGLAVRLVALDKDDKLIEL
ncbi:MAG: hypothetical protein NTV63_04445 [Candidatus Woesearchaeota archaeon]|nr:hypothetical protein [Candidatus Woesearchaeota archaeon]